MGSAFLIQRPPEAVSELENDSNYISEEEMVPITQEEIEAILNEEGKE